MHDSDIPAVLKSRAEQTVEARFGRDIRDILDELYNGERRLTQRQIAQELDVDRSTVVEWMKRHGVATGYNRSAVPA